MSGIASVLVGFLRLYKRLLSPLLPRACRFTPTCSEYAQLALEKEGWFRGSFRAAARVARCTPFHPGGVDLP
jgi:putative membrane protein insertion efficiency factor